MGNLDFTPFWPLFVAVACFDIFSNFYGQNGGASGIIETMEEKQKQKKKKLKTVLLISGMALLILFVMVTSIVIHHQRKTLDKINEDNDKLPQQEIVKIL